MTMSDGHSTGGIDHDENCAACGVYERADGSRLCEGCRDALVTDGGQVGLELAAAEVDSLDSEVFYGPWEDSDG